MSAATSIRRSVTTGLIALFLASGTVAVGSSAPAEAAVVKPCKASMSVTQPRQYTKTSVKVSQVGARAKVTTTAKYKTTTTKKYATASTKGTAVTTYSIGRATLNRKVVVDVVATSGKTTWKCSTSFTPKR
ncbi:MULTISPECIES: hypothetical protein [Kocuria]|uniref:hypothetical protein n=1 Tax=Kocuria TaxID=57493 RepID=UPI0007EBC256|nr:MULTISPECIES: hypothetical protein [Kocuria]MCT2360344.1 hypothetical protein [Kocuria marina]OBA47808.1 hypothetical protein A5728_08490 [Kocuria sp. ICS0012]GHD85179.1 hypothetical protein GCM10007061_06030 [Kocuria marina]